ncbi:MAG: 2-oxoglutarate dehydrogenase, E2 component, dihydrolipoamide succinyltransferase [Bacteroidetes bacterium]|nr:2-oxoglutarate dehydrogenase, E2 component, dihydrolipoamide succinyltransferase [Bacteroidota bacterium]
MARVDVVMPKMGESVMEGTVLEWKKQIGDIIELDETLLEISTDKVDSEIPAPAAGKLVEILVQEGDTVDVGTPIAVIDSDVNAEIATGGGDPAPAEEPVVEKSIPEPEAPATAGGNGAAPSAAPAGGGERVNVVMPKMGESVMEGTVLSWAKQVGDEVELDETLLEISTDKVDSEIPSPAAGVLVEILVPEGETVDVGTPIAVIASGDGAAIPAATPAATPAPEPVPQPAASPTPAPSGDGAAIPVVTTPVAAGAPIQRRGSDGRFYSPLVRSIAETEGLSMGELEAIAGTGADGRVTKSDVMGYLHNRGAQPAAVPAPKAVPTPVAVPAVSKEGGARVEVIEMNRMRQLIAEHMTRSKATSAHVTSFTEIDMTGVVAHREKHKADFLAREGTKLTYTPYFLYAAIEPIRAHPLMNSSVEGTRIMVKKDFHIGIAVAIGSKGLLVPVVRNAGQHNLTGLAHAVADLADRARNKQLLPDELQGGTFTITNVGSLGSLMGTPIINQPQVAILSPGAIVKRPVVVEDPVLGDVIAIRQMMYVSLSDGPRLIDGAMAASFLRAYKESLEEIVPDSTLF